MDSDYNHDISDVVKILLLLLLVWPFLTRLLLGHQLKYLSDIQQTLLDVADCTSLALKSRVATIRLFCGIATHMKISLFFKILRADVDPVEFIFILWNFTNYVFSRDRTTLTYRQNKFFWYGGLMHPNIHKSQAHLLTRGAYTILNTS